MFAKKITDSDMFLDMPPTAQLLYFHLSIHGDDDGFINNPKSIMRNIGSHDDDMKLLIAKKFIIPFESGVIVITHWKIHNYIRNDRYHETDCKTEKSQLETDKNNIYTLNKNSIYGIPNDNQQDTMCLPNGIPLVDKMDTEVRLGKVSIDKVNKKEKEKEKMRQAKKPTELFEKYTQNPALLTALDDFFEMRKKTKSIMTNRAIELMLSKLDKLASDDETKIAILNQSVMNSWKGIFELKNNNNRLPSHSAQIPKHHYDIPF
ncbi:hypothetical protein [Pectinatus frisingensis]|uniref:hypothetical protein n=1 Tax=Pectinatus frisingensis TaxID=865 RepID=UPI0018C5B389|nr:hypothetical protein [Pectinatus frisingensis]